jgi:hypothetical protein
LHCIATGIIGLSSRPIKITGSPCTQGLRYFSFLFESDLQGLNEYAKYCIALHWPWRYDNEPFLTFSHSHILILILDMKIDQNGGSDIYLIAPRGTEGFWSS